jgi:MoxR-like ATPase
VAAVRLSDEIVDYVVDLVRATREHPALVCGASPRAASMLASAARSNALLAGRDYVVPDDVKKLARAALRHRVVVAPGAEIEGRSSADVVAEVVQRTAAPR